MELTAILPRMTCLALIAGAIPAITAADEPGVLAQDLVKVRDSGRISAAIWTRRPDSYTLQLVFPVSGSRASFFIGNTIANLRDLDPAFGGRTLTLVDGRRVVPAGTDAIPPRPAEAAPQKVSAAPSAAPRIQVWLLRADGTQILPTWRSAEPSAAKDCGFRCIASEMLYRFPLTESAQAVAAAISIDDQYYIEKLQPLEPKPAAQ